MISSDFRPHCRYTPYILRSSYVNIRADLSLNRDRIDSSGSNQRDQPLRRTMTASIENVQNDAARELARQKSKCQFCNDLEFGSKMVGVQVDDWVFGTCRSSCLCCQILVKAIRRIEPDFLTGPPHPDRSIVLSADKTGRISSWIIKDGWSHPGLEIQLFNTTG